MHFFTHRYNNYNSTKNYISPCLLMYMFLLLTLCSTPSHYRENGVSTDLVVHILHITTYTLVYMYVEEWHTFFAAKSSWEQLTQASSRLVVYYKYILLHPINSSLSFFFFGANTANTRHVIKYRSGCTAMMISLKTN